MSCLVPPLRLVAVEYRTIMKGGNTKPTLVVAEDECDETRQVVLKLRRPTASVGDGHFAGTSLACELICAALARAVGLKVPDYAIVEITRGFANSIQKSSTRNLFLNNIGLNFGSVYHKSFALWQPMSYKPSPVVIDQLEDIISFDSIVINGDRQISKPNLLYHGDEFLLIDHSLALPVHLWNQQTLASSPLFPQEHINKHCASHHLRGLGHSYKRMFDNWRESINTQVLEELRAILPVSWEHKAGDVDKIFRFLDKRNRRFADMSDSLRRVLS